jgi:hypothetical protein
LSSADKVSLLWREFTRDGHYRKIMTGSQIVVNQEKLLDDTSATVEVSYIERKSRVQYYTKMRLKLRDGVWVVTSLREDTDH